MLTETLLHQTMDGSVWAKDFMERFGHRKDQIDESLMLSWFCNAIMAGYDHAQRKGVTLVPVEPQPMQDAEVQENIVYHDGTYTYWKIVRPGKYQPCEIESPAGTIGVTQLNDGLWVWITEAPE